MSKKFEIKNLRTVQNCGTLRATFTAAFTALELNDCKLVEGQNGLFFSPPSRKYEKDGATKYANYFYVTSEALRKEIEADALAGYAKLADRGSQGQYAGQGQQHDDGSEVPF